MQETLAENHQSPGGAIASTTGGLFTCPGQIVWRRSDWPSPVASFNAMHTMPMRSQVHDKWLSWVRVHIPELLLERGAALLLLQGYQLTQLLIPNHSVELKETSVQLAHLVLRVDPWEMWRPVSKLTNLVLAGLDEVPLGVSSTEVLAALASDSV